MFYYKIENQRSEVRGPKSEVQCKHSFSTGGVIHQYQRLAISTEVKQNSIERVKPNQFMYEPEAIVLVASYY